MNAVEYPFWVWIVFFTVVLAALAVDLGIANRRSHLPTRSETFAWSAVWISLALLFDGFIYWMINSHLANHELALAKSKEFFTGYLIELSLSVDNLFVFLLIFNYFKVPKKFQHRVLFWGIFMALVLRMVMIFAGAELVEKFDWILYLFGAFLIYTGFKMFFESDENFNPEESVIIRWTTKFIPISKTYDEEKFFTYLESIDARVTEVNLRSAAGKISADEFTVEKKTRRVGTLLLLVLIVINVVDLVFAVDSIPAIFGITTDRFIVYTSNIFAILGLRTFFFLLVDMAEKFHFLKYGLAFVLSFIGVKMLLPLLAEGLIMVTADGSATTVFLHRFLNREFDQTLINFSLGTVAGALALSIILSLIFPSSEELPRKEI
ncbi:MAG: TerC/Alx family metal homeostasis membrane protein [Pyrinomonadaceae bacterium]